MELEITFGEKSIETPVYVKMDAREHQLLLSEGVCRQLGIVQYHPQVQMWRGRKSQPPKKEAEKKVALILRVWTDKDSPSVKPFQQIKSPLIRDERRPQPHQARLCKSRSPREWNLKKRSGQATSRGELCNKVDTWTVLIELKFVCCLDIVFKSGLLFCESGP